MSTRVRCFFLQLHQAHSRLCEFEGANIEGISDDSASTGCVNAEPSALTLKAPSPVNKCFFRRCKGCSMPRQISRCKFEQHAAIFDGFLESTEEDQPAIPLLFAGDSSGARPRYWCSVLASLLSHRSSGTVTNGGDTAKAPSTEGFPDVVTMGGAVAMETGGIEAQEVASHFDQRQGSCCASVRARSCCRVLRRWASVLEKDEVVAVLRSVHVCERSRKPEIQ
ncbi:hypothetical protein HPB51_002298 [Rhipicephalus microplus]|uniref:Uncharacterized protein n=1 Tax=Rhipicephalus microplus TaxID=6941 RepID=A0A9J6D7V5_RHIMP|nr:hypothetical protein HPB51_002298 [Rhipicephalus microplus]